MTETTITQARPEITDVLDIAVRGYGISEKKKPEFKIIPRGPSAWYLIFDTETTTDETQRLRFGTYQVRYGADLREKGIFFDPDALKPAEINLIRRYGREKGQKIILLAEFREKVFLQMACYWRATIVGFNLPFDISRISSAHGDAKGKMRPGFSFAIGAINSKGPRIRIKHLYRRASLIETSGLGRRLPRGQRKRGVQAPPRKPVFLDVSTLAAALLSRSFSLGELAHHLKTQTRKIDIEGHGKILAAEYLDYAMQDVQVTWECLVALVGRYREHGLNATPIYRILSEAGIGKGYLREMGIRPWRAVQPNFSPEIIGQIMGSYFGGRAEVHLRRVIIRVLYCDFTSMYPTVSALMGLWSFVIAKGITTHDATKQTRRLLERIEIADLQRPETWQKLQVIVQLDPDADILPVRTKYQVDQFTIGLNHLTSDKPLWYTLADCIASKLLSGHAPKVVRAISFKPREPQDGLKPVAIAGKPEFSVDPNTADFFKRIIELRMQTSGPERNALKLVANSTGYGIFVQLDVDEKSEPVPIRCYPSSGPQFLVDMNKVEEPGEFFHPLLGTLITGAARLMLAITERLVTDNGLTWAFCDTDSMAIAKPGAMEDADFLQSAQRVRNWFKPLNPYSVDIELFKIEDANFRIANGRITNELEPLYCYAISSKRYVLFNLDGNGQPLIRKASAHGLGHLLPPYRDDEAPTHLPVPPIPLSEMGVRRWQHDLWHCIVRAALAGNPNQPDFSALPNFDRPAMGRYALTTARISDWFAKLNEGKSYTDQVRPFNFMAMYQAHPSEDWAAWRLQQGIVEEFDPTPPCVVGPFHSDGSKAVRVCFDRETGISVPEAMLKTYSQALAQYHLRPEPKFLHAEYRDSGVTLRRHVRVASIVHIGKEANRWEEQSYLGIDPTAGIDYGRAQQAQTAELAYLQNVSRRFGPTTLSRKTGVSRQHIASILAVELTPGEAMLGRLVRAAKELEMSEDAASKDALLIIERVKREGIRKCAALARVNAGHLTRVICGQRKMTAGLFQSLKRII